MNNQSQQLTNIVHSSDFKIITGLIILQVATVMPFGILSLLLDQMTAALALQPSQTGIFFGVAGIGAAGGWFGGGWLLRHFDRPNVFKMLLLGEAGALIVAAVSPHWLLSVVAFFFVGFCQCGALSGALSVATDLNPGKSAGNISLIMASNLTVPLFAWGTGCLLSHGAGWRVVLGLATAPLVISTIWMSLLVLPKHETSVEDENGDRSEALASWNDVFEFPVKFLFPCLMILTGFSITICIYGWAGIIGERLLGGIEKASYAAAVMLFGIGFGQLMIGTFLRNYSPKKLIIIVSCLMLVVSGLLMINFTNWLIWGLFLGVGLIGGMFQPLSISLAEKEMGSTSHRSIAIVGLWGEGGAALVYYLIGHLGFHLSNFVNCFCVAMIICTGLLMVAIIKLRGKKNEN